LYLSKHTLKLLHCVAFIGNEINTENEARVIINGTEYRVASALFVVTLFRVVYDFLTIGLFMRYPSCIDCIQARVFEEAYICGHFNEVVVQLPERLRQFLRSERPREST
jgi:hypothetical protein